MCCLDRPLLSVKSDNVQLNTNVRFIVSAREHVYVCVCACVCMFVHICAWLSLAGTANITHNIKLLHRMLISTWEITVLWKDFFPYPWKHNECVKKMY